MAMALVRQSPQSGEIKYCKILNSYCFIAKHAHILRQSVLLVEVSGASVRATLSLSNVIT